MLGGHGTVSVSVDGCHLATVSADTVPRLYTLYQAAATHSGTLRLQVSPGVQAYDFTFG